MVDISHDFLRQIESETVKLLCTIFKQNWLLLNLMFPKYIIFLYSIPCKNSRVYNGRIDLLYYAKMLVSYQMKAELNTIAEYLIFPDVSLPEAILTMPLKWSPMLPADGGSRRKAGG